MKPPSLSVSNQLSINLLKVLLIIRSSQRLTVIDIINSQSLGILKETDECCRSTFGHTIVKQKMGQWFCPVV